MHLLLEGTTKPHHAHMQREAIQESMRREPAARARSYGVRCYVRTYVRHNIVNNRSDDVMSNIDHLTVITRITSWHDGNNINNIMVMTFITLVWGRGPGNPVPGDPRTVYPGGRAGTRQVLVCTTIHLMLMHGCQACKAAGAGRGTLDAGHWRWLGLEARNIEHRNLVFTSDRPGP